MPEIPRDRWPDSTPALLIEGYEFVSNRCRRLGTDIFEARINLQPTVCVRGIDAAALFYDTDNFRREGAAPRRMRKTLFGEGGVQGLDDAPHRHRKAMFLALMGDEQRADLVRRFRDAWQARSRTWASAGEVVLHDEVGRMLTEAVHDWAGVPLSPSDVGHRLADLRAMIVGGGGLGPNYLRGRWGRRRAERELAQVVEAVRSGQLPVRDGSAMAVIAGYRRPDGRPLPSDVAAVELLNVLRPTVAVDRYVALLALALEEHPRWQEELEQDADLLVPFVHEVRRYYPFFPFAAAIARRRLDWRGYTIPQGQRVLLDLYATNHDPDAWETPGAFDPLRFVERDIGPFELVPQGGGDHAHEHRCAGEWLTIELMTEALRLLVYETTYTLPSQDLRLQRGKVPALPTSGVRLVVTG